MNEEIIKTLSQLSLAFAAGVETAKLNIPLEKSGLKNIHHGTPDYDDFLSGYNAAKVIKESQ